MRRATRYITSDLAPYMEFLSTLSLRRATIMLLPMLYRNTDFYPRSPCGERLIRSPHREDGKEFLSTLSLRRATTRSCGCTQSHNISIHALLAESDGNSGTGFLCGVISIHALLAESDYRKRLEAARSHEISIHALLAEGDAYIMIITICTA